MHDDVAEIHQHPFAAIFAFDADDFRTALF